MTMKNPPKPPKQVSPLLFQEILSSASDAILSMDETQRIILFNKQAEAIFGYQPQEVIKKPLNLLLPDRFRESHVEHVKGFTTEDVTRRYMSQRPELIGLRKNGEEFPVEITISKSKVDGKMIFTAIVRDITERKQAEDALQLVMKGTSSVVGEQFFRSLVRYMAAAMKVRWAFISQLADAGGKRIRIMAFWAGTSYIENFEYSSQGTPCENVIGKAFCYYPNDVQRLFPKDAWLREEGVESYLALPLFDSAGNALGHLGVMHDRPMKGVSSAESILKIFAARAVAELERKQAEEKINSLARFPNENPHPVLRVAKDGTILYANTASLPLLETWSSQIGQPLPDYWRQFILDVLNSGKSNNVEVECNSRILTLVFAPVVSSDYVNLYGMDITERKLAEEVLHQKTAFIQLLQEIAVAANESLTIENAMQVALDKLCAHTGWPVGHVYLLADDNTGELVPSTIWHLEGGKRFETFRKVTEATRFDRGVGLPGRVLASGKPAWIIDVTKDPNFPRAKLALKIGVKAGFAFPVLIGKEVVAVLEFFSQEAIEPDNSLLEVIAHIGTQLGRVIERKRAEESVQHMAYYDPMTDLPNRTLLHRHLQEAILAGQRENKSVALILMDLDQFKDINDTLGHQRGDILLKEISSRLQNAMFQRDMVARLGGDEFAVLLPLAESGHASLVAEKVVKILEPPFLIEGISIAVEASIGIALFPDHSTDAEGLIRRADVAMYIAKHAKQGVTFYDPAQDKHSPQKLALMGELRHAIENEELVLYYQPKINLKTNRVMGVEALVRWKHPKRGMIPPYEFIEPAERTGLIKPLTLWVFNTALRQCHDFQKTGMEISISINLSTRNLQDPALPDQIGEKVKACGLAPGMLEFEITESAIMDDPEHALEVISHLKGLGVKFAIDDFGTGYSSLGYLRKLPVDVIKIDRSFVKDMTENKDNAAIVRSTIDLAHDLGLWVIAEGVEDKETYDQLTAMGCDAAQGYYMCKPIPEEALATWLRESPWGLGKQDKSR